MLLLEMASTIVRVVLPEEATSTQALACSPANARGIFEVGRRLRIAGYLDGTAGPCGLPVAQHVEFLDLQ